jgi:HD-GYP domain-containing protein (c-di-GMP phosphodiesterase class II)
MSNDRSIALRTFVYRTLALRLALVTIAIAVAVSTVTYFRYRSLFEQQVVGTVQDELALLMGRASRIAAERGTNAVESVRIALAERSEIRRARKFGRFVYVRLSSPGLAHPLEVSDLQYRLLAAARALLPATPPYPLAERITAQKVHLNGIPHVRVLAPIRSRDGRAAGEAELVFAASDETVAEARSSLLRTIAIVVAIVVATAALLYPVILRLVRRLADFSDNLLEANLAALSLLGAAIAKRDSDTDAHNYRVTIYALRLGEAIGLPPAEMRGLLKGAFLHDVGKIAIRDDILLKPGKLTEEELRVMRTHVDHGIDVVRRSAWLADAVAVVGSHHEKFDGSGYPNGTRGSDIPIAARIFAIVDVFDALTSRRPYKQPFAYEESVTILEQGRGRHFDAALLDAFLAIAPELYRQYAGREDHGIKRELEDMARRQFHAGLDTLVY